MWMWYRLCTQAARSIPRKSRITSKNQKKLDDMSRGAALSAWLWWVLLPNAAWRPALFCCSRF